MIASLQKRVYEAIRCARHNLLHLKMFRISFDGSHWRVRDPDGLVLRFPFYPYLAFHEIEGYLCGGRLRIVPGMTVIDAGGCFGEFSIYAAKKVGPTGRVIMLEPDPANLGNARKVFALNGDPQHLQIDTFGLWRTPGRLAFAAGLGGESHVVEVSGPTPPDGSVFQIEVETLGTLMDKRQLLRLDFIKMDIEGAEVEVIEGGLDVIRKFHPIFSIASYHMREGKPTSEIMTPILRDCGYSVDTGNPFHQTTWATPNDA